MTCRAATALVLAVALLGASEARANGGTLRLARATAGPYLVSVWTQPDPPRVGRLDVSVAVMRPEDGSPVLDVLTTVGARSADEPASSSIRVAIRGGGGNLLLYHADLELPRPGLWRVTVTVQAPSGRGSASFEVTAVRGSRLAPLLGAAAILAILAWTLPRLVRRVRVALTRFSRS